MVLAQRFLRVEQDRQYVPERGRQGDLEKLRDFGERAQGKDWLQVFHTEAGRGGAGAGVVAAAWRVFGRIDRV